MRITKHRAVQAIIFTLISGFFFSQFTSCKKETIIIKETILDTINVILHDTLNVHDTVNFDSVCPISGTYVGTGTPNVGFSSNAIYTFAANHFVEGRHELNQAAVSFGGYRNTCDSVIFSVYYNINSSYYLLKGKFSNNRNTIAGTFKNLNTPTDFGVFTITK